MKKKDKRIIDALTEYVSECSSGGKNDKRLPNICGLCRHLGIGKRELLAILSENRELADIVFTVLEDEAVNSGASGTVFTQYLHMIEDVREEVFGGSDSSGITAVFGHSDGEEDLTHDH